jgi:hypothetical protein
MTGFRVFRHGIVGVEVPRLSGQRTPISISHGGRGCGDTASSMGGRPQSRDLEVVGEKRLDVQ